MKQFDKARVYSPMLVTRALIFLSLPFLGKLVVALSLLLHALFTTVKLTGQSYARPPCRSFHLKQAGLQIKPIPIDHKID